MLKSILSVFTGAFGMIFRVIAIIVLCFTAGYCFFSMLEEPFIWSGAVRLAGIAACALVILFLLRLGREKDDTDDDGLPHPESRPKKIIILSWNTGIRSNPGGTGRIPRSAEGNADIRSSF